MKIRATNCVLCIRCCSHYCFQLSSTLTSREHGVAVAAGDDVAAGRKTTTGRTRRKQRRKMSPPQHDALSAAVSVASQGILTLVCNVDNPQPGGGRATSAVCLARETAALVDRSGHKST